MRIPLRGLTWLALPALGFGLLPGGAGAAPSLDQARAVNVVAPGESGFISLTGFANGTNGGSYGDHFADQLSNYSDWKYKPFQFGPTGGGTHPGGRPDVTFVRDGHGVPQIYADDEIALAYGIGYTMAQDRLFQMEIFRRVGHGTLAELVGASGLPMDEAVRHVTEGVSGRAAELAAHPDQAARLDAFSAGVNQVINEATVDPRLLPAEFVLLNDLPISPWTADDTLAFGEYAGRFFGEFGHGELSAAQTYLNMVDRLGQPAAERALTDLLPLDDPAAPAIIPAADGLFPVTPGTPVATSYTGSPFANHDPGQLPSRSDVNSVAVSVDVQQAAVKTLQRVLGIPRFGSNAIVVDGSKTADGHPLIWSGPQTGWAVPGFFWEAEMHDPLRDQRGVMVPAIPLMVIGRNSDSAFSVTSGTVANSDLFVEQLTPDNSASIHNGGLAPVTSQAETIPCHNPPTVALALLHLGPPTLCPALPVELTYYHSIHGQALADPDVDHHLYVRASSVDAHILDSFAAWDSAGLQHTAATFGAAMATNSLGFNYFYADAAGEIAYFHTGRTPIRPANADPTLPLPGSGAYDWQGYELWNHMPHDVNPSTHFLVNWNNKPAAGWFSKSLEASPTRFGADHHVVPLSDEVAAMSGINFDRFGTIPEDVAYRDNRARVFIPLVAPALAASGDPTLVSLASGLNSWDQQRTDTLVAAPAFFDRLIEHLVDDTLGPTLGSDLTRVAGFNANAPACPTSPCHYVSLDNLSASTMKFEYAALETVAAALRGTTATDFFAGAGADAVVVRAARDAVAEWTAASGSADPASWKEPVETAHFSAQGGGSVPDVVPLPNRGSYGQVVEPGGVPEG